MRCASRSGPGCWKGRCEPRFADIPLVRWDGDGIGLSQFHALQPQQGKRLSACVPQASEGRCPHLTGYAMEA
jgi:hypothetical protein